MHSCILIRVFDGRCMGSQGSSVSSGVQLRLIRLCGCADWFGSTECNRCMVKGACAPNKDSDQSAHACFLIKVFDGPAWVARGPMLLQALN